MKSYGTKELQSGGPISAKRKWLRKLSLRLALDFKILPSCSTVEVINVETNSTYLGGNADIFKARHSGNVVALKRFRINQGEITSEKLKVRDKQTLSLPYSLLTNTLL